MRLQHKIAVILIILFLMICLGLSLLSQSFRETLFSSGLTAETKGLNLAIAGGCFHCHGSYGAGGIPNPGGDSIPSWQGYSFMMSMENEEELREWIMDGAPEKLRTQSSYARRRQEMTVHMPAYRSRLTKGELNKLVAFYHAVSGTIRPDDPLAKKGYGVAETKGCFSCHGIGGRFDLVNPGSLTGFIPAWSGPNFKHLVHNEAELREWILDGRSKRLWNNPFSRYFSKRQMIKMPEYRDRLSQEELEALLAYFAWLRDRDAPGHRPRFSY